MLNDKEKSLVKLSMNKEWTNPKYKLKWFVGQAQITPFAKFRQWLLEIKSKEESIENMEYEIAKLDVEYDRYKRMRDQSSDPLDKRLAEIEMWNTDRLRYTSKRRLQDWYLERQHLIDLLHEFMESEESKLPDGSGRTYMDIIDTEEEDVYEYEYWTNRLAKQAACDMLFYGRVNSGNMDAILSMSPEQQAETLALTVNFSTQLQQYQLKLQSDAESALKNKLEMDNKALLTPSEVKYIEENMPLYDKSIKNADQEEMLNVYTIRNDSQ
jgi:hypothetical protein